MFNLFNNVAQKTIETYQKRLKPKTPKTLPTNHQTGPKTARKESARAPRSFREYVQKLSKQLLKSKPIKTPLKNYFKNRNY